MSEGPKFTDLVASGDSEALYVNDLMKTQAYLEMNGSERSQNVRSYVERYFSKTFGHAPAAGSRQRNTVGRGDLSK